MIVCNPGLPVKINRPGLAGLCALLAFLFLQKQAMVRINIVCGRDCLCISNINGLFRREILVIGIGYRYRTVG